VQTFEERRTRKDFPGALPFCRGATILDTGIEYGKIRPMNSARKITVEVPEKLLERAQEASGEGITQTVRTGLQLVAASRTYARLRALRGKVKFSRTAADLKDDR
jgi:hypothetical protein